MISRVHNSMGVARENNMCSCLLNPVPDLPLATKIPSNFELVYFFGTFHLSVQSNKLRLIIWLAQGRSNLIFGFATNQIKMRNRLQHYISSHAIIIRQLLWQREISVRSFHSVVTFRSPLMMHEFPNLPIITPLSLRLWQLKVRTESINIKVSSNLMEWII